MAVCLSQPACGGSSAGLQNVPAKLPSESANERVDGMKLSIKVGDKTVNATLIDNETTRDFVSLLPLMLTMNDLFGREKFAHLPRAISDKGQRRRTYDIGQIVYWSPGPDVAIFYRHDAEEIPGPGIIVIGRIDSGTDAFAVPGTVKVKIELVK